MDAIYCPMPDSEMEGYMRTFSNSFNAQIIHRGQGLLGTLDSKDKLYIISHGHSRLPVFCVKSGAKMSPRELGLYLQDEGLKHDHKVIELLVCHAGESIPRLITGTVTGDKILSALKLPIPKPAPFLTSSQLLPLAAQLMGILKELNYTNLQIISYACEVSTSFDTQGVRLHLHKHGGRKDALAKNNPTFRKEWL